MPLRTSQACCPYSCCPLIFLSPKDCISDLLVLLFSLLSLLFALQGISCLFERFPFLAQRLSGCSREGKPLLSRWFFLAKILGWHIRRTKLARRIFSRHKYCKISHEKCSENFPEVFEHLFCGPGKVQLNSRQTSSKISIPPPPKNSPTSFCRSAGRKKWRKLLFSSMEERRSGKVHAGFPFHHSAPLLEKSGVDRPETRFGSCSFASASSLSISSVASCVSP